MPESTDPGCPFIVAGMGLLLFFFADGILPAPSSSAHNAAPIPAQRPGKAASPHVGAAMALLATLEQAQVLPPEGTKEADRVIKSVIQLQSLFTKSTDPSVQEFMRRAVTSKQGEQATQVLTQFQSNGWTPDVLEALAHEALHGPAEALQRLTQGLGSVNLSVDDFRYLMQLVRDGEQALTHSGKNFHDVFASHRKMMPGAGGR